MAQDQPSVYLTWPTIFHPVPDNLPPTVPPPFDERTFRAPFGIDPDLYNFVLRPEIPLCFATVYIVSVFALNAYNRGRKHEPWWISKTAAFGYFVVVHNVVLALYSFATFAAMARAIVETWPGLDNPNGAAGVADALCKLHGPRGLGDAATFNTTINIWEVKNSAIRLLPSGNPDPTDVGRLWNEGLAFWGWIFYVSKFYEVLDTLIILAKGKRSATLQTYHHAGAMLCMWAGIRYMSPPIWMFVFINSAIHAMMYTYFTASALKFKVPQSLKRTLTSLQIAQFVFGASYAAAHLFVAYDIPLQTPYQVVSAVERAVSTASSAASAVTSSVSEFVETPTVTASIGSLVKKLLLRAAGEEGVAERVAMSKSDASAYLPSVPQMEQKMEKIWERRFETHYRSEWTRVNCIDTSGEAFAIYLNLLYLAPLTWLFGRFFVRAYTARGKGAKPRTASATARLAADMAKDARRDTEQSFEEGGIQAEDELQRRGSQGKEKGEELYEQLRKDVKSMKDGTWRDRRVSERVQSYEGKVKTAAEKAKETVKNAVNGSRSSGKETSGETEKQDESAVDDSTADVTEDQAAAGQEESAVDDSTADVTEDQPAAGQNEDAVDDSTADVTEDQPAAGQDEDAVDDSTADAEDQPAAGQQGNAEAAPQPDAASKAEEEEAEPADDSTSAEPAATSEPAADKQEDNTGDAESTQPAPESTKEQDAPSDDARADQGEDEDKLYSEVVAGSGEESQGGDSKPEDSPGTPQAENKPTEDDTDAMGRSGVGIDASDTSSPSSSKDTPSTESKPAET